MRELQAHSQELHEELALSGFALFQDPSKHIGGVCTRLTPASFLLVPDLKAFAIFNVSNHIYVRHINFYKQLPFQKLQRFVSESHPGCGSVQYLGNSTKELVHE